MSQHKPWRLVFALGMAQIVSWGSYFYAFALLMQPLQQRLDSSASAVVGAFSLALLVAGLLAAPVGRWIDRHGGRALMSLGSLAGALLLALLPLVQSTTQLYLIWAGIGTAMAATLYDPAFAVIAQLFRDSPRKAITVLTLFGGLASTVFWPLTQGLVEQLGWQRACWVLAAINLLLCLPVHLLLPGSSAAPPGLRRSPAEAARAPPGWRELLARPGFAWLCAAFTANTLVFSALSVHLLNLLMERGIAPQQAAWIGAAVGPMQVLGRALEFAFLRHIRPSRLGALTLWLLPASLLALTLVQPGALVWAGLFALLYGSGNGMMTIVRGALPAELFGREHYGAINGALSTPVLLSKAAGPLLAAWLLTHFQTLPLLAAFTGLGVLAALLFGMAVRAHERSGKAR